jgi:hypothetical protein
LKKYWSVLFTQPFSKNQNDGSFGTPGIADLVLNGVLPLKGYEGLKKAGNFTLSTGIKVPGELFLKGAATTLNLYSDSPFDPHLVQELLGTFYDRSKVSLIECITVGSSSFNKRDKRHYSCSVFPHFVIFGNQHINSSERVIKELRFTVDDGKKLFYDFDAFGSVIDARTHMERIADAKEGDRKIEIGEHPQIFYFTGKYEIIAVDTVLGKISVNHGFGGGIPGPGGIQFENTIWLNIAFDTERTATEAIQIVIDTLRFLEIIAGRPQNILKLEFFPVSTENYPDVHDVYWCMPPRRNPEEESGEPHPADLPIRAAIDKDDFTNVLKRWLERHDEWRNARSRFSTVFAYQNRYCTDRLVGAANMFDIMPKSACPETVPLDSDLEIVRDEARKAFKELPNSPERDSVLSVLGRIGKPTLKRKIRARANLIIDIVGEKLPELYVIVDQAVNCRNYYVHGTEPKFDYEKYIDQVYFFTDTLEFVFAASDLIEAGWDISAWIKRGSSQTHPFGTYCLNYALRLRELKKLL